MNYEWDPDKAEANRRKHGVDFMDAEAFAWDEALGWVDAREGYGETREIAVAPIHGRLHVMVFTLRGARIRIISLRKANSREVAAYGQVVHR